MANEQLTRTQVEIMMAFLERLGHLPEIEVELQKKTNVEIGSLVFHHLWPELTIYSAEEALLTEACKRLGFNPDQDKEQEDE
jgi:hypothetical protein